MNIHEALDYYIAYEENRENIDLNNVNCYKEELRTLRTKIKKKSPSIMYKYLLGNQRSKEVSRLNFEYHLGSNSTVEPINKKQWEVVNTIISNELIAVSGFKDTDRLRLIEEIIADNVVRKTMNLILCWDIQWQKSNDVNKPIYYSPFRGDNKYSIVLMSEYNKQLNNATEGILLDVKEIQNKISTKIKYSISSRIRETTVTNDLNKEDVKVFIKELKEAKIDKLIMSKIERFKKLIDDSDEYSKNVRTYTKSINQLKYLNILDKNSSKMSITKIGVIIDTHKQIIEDEKKVTYEKELLIKDFKDKERLLLNNLDTLKLEKKQYKRKLRDCKKKIIEITTILQIPILGSLIIKIIYGGLNSWKNEEKNISKAISEINNNINYIYERMEYNNERVDKLIEEIGKGKEKIARLNLIISESQLLIKSYKFLKLIVDKDVLISMESTEYNLNVTTYITDIRNQLCECSLLIDEAYLINNKEAILYNLEYMLDGEQSAIRNFNKSDLKYEKYEKEVRHLWETFCMCFPVINMSLESSEQRKIPMIEKLFDLMIVDKGEQISPHYVLPPLYRSKRALFVGEIKQSKGLREDNMNNGTKEENVCAQKLALEGSDICNLISTDVKV